MRYKRYLMGEEIKVSKINKILLTEPTGNDIPEGSVWVGGTVST
jgi:hypothetical protein